MFKLTIKQMKIKIITINNINEENNKIFENNNIN